MAQTSKIVEAELDATAEEIREALAEALGYNRENDPRPEGVHTTSELALMFGASMTQMRRRIREALEAGTMELVRFHQIDALARRQPMNGYRMVIQDD